MWRSENQSAAGRPVSTAVLFVLIVLAPSCGRSGRITIGSKNFTEQIILGEILSQHIEEKLGVKVSRRLDLGGTLLAHQALVSGQIDLYPEYTGTALTTVLKLPISRDPDSVLDSVRKQYRERWGIEWLSPLGFNNTFVMVIRGSDARRKNIQTLSEAAGRPKWVLGVGYEFFRRPDGLAGLLETYRLDLAHSPLTMDLGLLYRALEQGRIDMAAANATDGLLSVLDVQVLRDDRHYFPPYQAAVAIRASVLKQHPDLEAALEDLSGRLSDQVMRKLNYEVDGKHRSAAIVAREFLHSQ